MSKFICSVCGYIYEGANAPDKCPICKAPISKFKVLDGENLNNGELDSSNEDIEESIESDLNINDDDREIYKIIKAEGIEKAIDWYKKNNFCSNEEAKEIVTLISDKYNAVEINKKKERGKGKSVKKKNNNYFLIGGIIIAIVILGAILSKSNSGTDQSDNEIAVDSIVEADSIIMDKNSPKYIKSYLEDMLNKAIKLPDERAVETYFTSDFRNLFKDVENFDEANIEPGDIGFWDFNMWTGGQDGDLDSVAVLEIQDYRNKKSATAIVQFIVKFGKYDESKSSTDFKLLFENDEWRIDDFNNYKWRFKDYLENIDNQEEVVDTVAADTIMN